MNLLHKVAVEFLRRLQNLALYRRLGRRALRSITLREVTAADLVARHLWLNPNGAPFHSIQPNPNVTNWVADYYGHLAGFVQLVHNSSDNTLFTGYWLFSLYIKTQWQGLGIGERLSQMVIERAKVEGAPTLDLLVYEDNIRAIRLYRKLDFEMHTIPELEIQLENERATTGRRRVVMRKKLANDKTRDYVVADDTTQIISNARFAELIAAVLAKGAPFRFQANGSSMSPFIRDGDVITISTAPIRIGLGEMVAFVNPDHDRLTVHRVVQILHDGYLIQGDNIPKPDGCVSRSDIIGRVIRVEHQRQYMWLGLGPERIVIAFLSRHGWLVPLLIPFRWIFRIFIRRSIS